jgi:Zn-finger nucleic acid-binding protein
MKLCPECNIKLKEMPFDVCSVDYCSSCQGYFFDPKELEKVSGHQESKKLIITSSSQQVIIKRRVRSCPNCSSKMAIKEKGGIEIDRCIFCGGVWLDGGEFQKISKILNAQLEQKTKQTEKKTLNYYQPKHSLLDYSGSIAEEVLDVIVSIIVCV